MNIRKVLYGLFLLPFAGGRPTIANNAESYVLVRYDSFLGETRGIASAEMTENEGLSLTKFFKISSHDYDALFIARKPTLANISTPIDKFIEIKNPWLLFEQNKQRLDKSNAELEFKWKLVGKYERAAQHQGNVKCKMSESLGDLKKKVLNSMSPDIFPDNPSTNIVPQNNTSSFSSLYTILFIGGSLLAILSFFAYFSRSKTDSSQKKPAYHPK